MGWGIHVVIILISFGNHFTAGGPWARLLIFAIKNSVPLVINPYLSLMQCLRGDTKPGTRDALLNLTNHWMNETPWHIYRDFTICDLWISWMYSLTKCPAPLLELVRRFFLPIYSSRVSLTERTGELTRLSLANSVTSIEPFLRCAPWGGALDGHSWMLGAESKLIISTMITLTLYLLIVIIWKTRTLQYTVSLT